MEGLYQPIGISLDLVNEKMYYGQAGNPLTATLGTVTEATLEGGRTWRMDR